MVRCLPWPPIYENEWHPRSGSPLHDHLSLRAGVALRFRGRSLRVPLQRHPLVFECEQLSHPALLKLDGLCSEVNNDDSHAPIVADFVAKNVALAAGA